MIKKINQENIKTESGDVVAGSKNIYNHYSAESSNTLLQRLFKDLTSEYNNDEKIENICEELIDYQTENDVEGLYNKLQKANCPDIIIEDAEFLKQKFSKKLYEFQNYPSAQKIFILFLAKVSELFRAKILPLLLQGKSVLEVQDIIYSDIIEPLDKFLNQEAKHDNVLFLNSEEIKGMIYYLTGRCHLKWSSKK